MALYQHFKTVRLTIRPVSVEDAPFILELMNSPKWIKYIGDRNVRTVKEAENYIQEKVLPQLKAHGYSNNVVIRTEDNIKLGTCGLYHRDGMDSVDIGFAFLPKNEGNGYAYEAASTLMHAAKHQYNLSELYGFTLEDNLSSRKLLKRLGFELIGNGKLPNNDEELLRYHRILDF